MKLLIEWAEALLKDLKRISPTGNLITSRQLLKMRAIHHNVLLSDKSWDDQVEAIRASHESPCTYCVHPSVHADMYKDTLMTIITHKATCWAGNNTSN